MNRYEELLKRIDNADFGYWIDENNLTDAIMINEEILAAAMNGEFELYSDYRYLMAKLYNKIVKANRQR